MDAVTVGRLHSSHSTERSLSCAGDAGENAPGGPGGSRCEMRQEPQGCPLDRVLQGT